MVNKKYGEQDLLWLNDDWVTIWDAPAARLLANGTYPQLTCIDRTATVFSVPKDLLIELGAGLTILRVLVTPCHTVFWLYHGKACCLIVTKPYWGVLSLLPLLRPWRTSSLTKPLGADLRWWWPQCLCNCECFGPCRLEWPWSLNLVAFV